MTNQSANNEKITEIELVYRNQRDISELPRISDCRDAHRILRETWDESKIDLQEQSRVLLLTKDNKCIGVSTLATGGTDRVNVDLKIIFGLAVKANASALIFAHNHPSGNLNFSESDIEMTKQMVEVGEALGLPVLDHLVITRNGFSSMEEKFLMPISNGQKSTLFENDNTAYSSSSNKPDLYIFKPNSSGEKPVGAVFMHGKGNGFNIVFDDKSRFVAFPPKPKIEAKVEAKPSSGKKPTTNKPK